MCEEITNIVLFSESARIKLYVIHHVDSVATS